MVTATVHSNPHLFHKEAINFQRDTLCFIVSYGLSLAEVSGTFLQMFLRCPVDCSGSPTLVI